MDKLYKMTATELQKLVATKQVSSTEVTKSVIERIEQTDKKVDAYITYNFEKALKQAEAVDAKLAAGEQVGSLAGVPVAVNDNIMTKDILSTCASKMLYNFVPPYESTVVARLYANDAILIGKTTLDEFGMGSTGETSYFKTAKNPWDLQRVAGGLSSGSAATVAASQVPMALASDTDGGIRRPAAMCGLVGLNPTYGAVSRLGLAAVASSYDQIGPITRNVEDNALLFKAISGKDKSDAVSKNYVFEGYSDNVKGMKFGLPKEYFTDAVDGEVKEKVMLAVQTLKELGAEIVEISLPSTEYVLATHYVISSAEISSNFGRYDGVKYGYQGSKKANIDEIYCSSRTEGFGEEVRRRIMMGTYFLSSGVIDVHYTRARIMQKRIREEFADAFTKCDAIIAPVTTTTAAKLGETVNNPVDLHAENICTVAANIAGLPAMSIPCGFASNGMPVGMQLIGNKFNESTLYTIANCYENAVGGFKVKEM